ncbi:restriction endonuclease subunit S [Streptomyces griseiscabiei]|uniref:Restriction endonuclease subunit S n=1 Tax=Streptomyces griseiscabiei TaxID=2993540 RepID=A0ABU4LE44_9ACTN|nr:restriction endonuclease subunit S [Streptomyces griseiscabiei]MBZ3906617.1 restriction endonuclease subunit S [Streptomyces griseiscabiei]MDX2913681.1 restriction endonuclease subunit S [Streptomyces griseiscabiei]
MSAYQGAIGMTAMAGLISPDYMVLRPGSRVDSKYLHYLFRSAWFTGEVVQRLRGIGSVDLGNVRTPRINPDDFGAIEIPLPSLQEQRRIAAFLDAETARVDALAVAMHSQDASLKQRRLRVLDFASECAPRTPLVRLGYLSRLVTSGSRGWGEFASDTGSLFFRSANLYSDRVHPKLTNVVYVQVPASATSEAQRSRIELGDVLVGITGANAGWVCMANADVAGGHVSQHVCLVRPDKRRINGDWLALLIASPAIQSRLMGNQYGGTKTQLSLPDIREIRIPLVPVEQQIQMARSIIRQIDEIDRQRLLRQRQLALLTERRQALITAAVTGQFDVSSASGRNVTDGVTAYS